MLRITHISPCFVDFEKGTGGVANVIRELAQQQSALGHEVRILDTDSVLGTVRGDASSRRHGNIEHITHPQPAAWRIPILQSQFTTLFRRSESDQVFHVHTCFGPFVDAASRALARLGTTFFFSAHGKLSPGMVDNRLIAKKLWWKLISLPGLSQACAIPMSSNEVDYFKSAGLTNITEVVNNGVEKLTDDYLQKLSKPIAEPYFLYFGYLDPRKQPELLVKAFANSRAARSHMLVFLGPNEYGHQAKIERAVEQCGIFDRVVFPGAAYGDEKWRWIRHAQCMCLPSKGEGQPLVVLESLGAGTPVVCSNLCNVDLSDFGIILDDFEPDKWSKAMDQVIELTNEEFRERARDFGRKFEWPTVTQRMLDCYQRHLLSQDST